MALPIHSNACINPNKSLGIDEACLNIINEGSKVSLFGNINSCYVCSGLPWGELPENSNNTFVISTKYPLSLYYKRNGLEWCHTTYKFQEHGGYGWNLSEAHICSYFYKLTEPDNPHLPILAAFMVFTIASVINATANFVIKVVQGFLTRNSGDDQSPLQESDSPPQPSMRITRADTRIRSIDAFRGIAVLLMIFVNNGGGGYVFFEHAPWDGLTVADLVLPWFAWIMGVTIILSVRSQLRLSIPRSRIILKAFKRSLIFIFLGLIISNPVKPSLVSLRITGVLQLLGITYFICATIEALFMKLQRNYQYGRLAFLQDVFDSWVQWLIVLILVAIHLLITFLLPVPGCPTGYLGPGGYHLNGKYANCTGGAAGYIDRMIFGNHTYLKKKNIIYGNLLPHDPEGLMNTLSAVLIVAMGLQAGRILFGYLRCFSKFVRWFAWAALTGIIAGYLCDWGFQGVLPVNKNMMTTSFTLIASCFAFLLFSILYYLIDYLRIWDGIPFIYAGANSIFLYVGHYFTMDRFPWSWKLENPSHTSLLAMNLWTTTLWGLIAYGLYKKDIIISV
ncbi:heparan-alpha-glucosaminide N-acetyltransferase-like [Chelonus insularis]|uniref:heparan-alpha-glucosaminide N-acetyltransferase-like n=1 Tax=Chelonus insularis TaxID=460826 RepID=UPI00158EE7CF|nr:heparan-alpha-glucosaminide N-acetyltransferase-like [Chelonus insularis]